ncbi:MAG: glycosyltransferase family 4 protein [Pseudomonadota bacterium]
MHILVLCHYYPPEVNAPASRTSEHAKIWVESGHEVTVITCAPNHPNGELYPGYRNRLYQTEIVDGVKVVRVWSWLAANEGFLPRIANYVSFAISSVLACPRVGKVDVVLSTSPQFFCGLAGAVAGSFKRAPWVLEIRDLWPESIVTVGAMKKGGAIRFLEWLEGWAYRKADRVVALTDGFVPHISEKRGRDDVLVIKNGVDLALFSGRGEGEATKAKFGLEGRVLAAYVGTHGMAHGLDTILDAAALLRDEPGIGFLLVGDGAERARLEARCKALSLNNVRIAGQLPKEQMPAIWAATDISLILLRKSDTFKTVLPSKMFEAMAMKCPIVLGVEGEAKALLEAADAGISIEPENAEELANAVMRLCQNPDWAEDFGRRGRAHVEENFNRTVLAGNFIFLFRSLRP